MVGFVEKIREHPITTTSIVAVRKVYGWVTENLWPVYSTGIVVSVMCMLAASQEKQILADHLYGRNQRFTENTTEITDNASKQLDEEVSIGIKRDVFTMSKAEFEGEYEARR